jgi:hypothetical protein
LIFGDVIDPIGRHFAVLLIFKIVHAHRFGLALWMPLPTSVFEISHQFLLFAVDGNHGLSSLLKRLTMSIDVLELRVPILMRGPFAGLA